MACKHGIYNIDLFLSVYPIIDNNCFNDISPISGGSRIFPGGAPTPKIAIIFHIFAENCMKTLADLGGARPARVPHLPGILVFDDILGHIALADLGGAPGTHPPICLAS